MYYTCLAPNTKVFGTRAVDRLGADAREARHEEVISKSGR